MKQRRPIRARWAVGLWIGGTALVLWLALMAAVTWITAHEADRWLSLENWDRTQYLVDNARGTVGYEIPEETGHYRLWDGMKWFGRLENEIGGGLLRTVQRPAQTAAVLYDGEGNVLEKNGTGLYFWYMTEENWLTAESDRYSDGVARTLYDNSQITETALEALRRSDVRALRMTGVLENGHLTPSKIEYISDREFYDLVMKYQDGTYEIHKLLQEMLEKGELEWKTLLSSSFEAEQEQVYYAVDCYASLYDAGDAVEVDGVVYDDLMSYLEETGRSGGSGVSRQYDTGNLWDRMLCRDIEIYEDQAMEASLVYRILAAVRYSPMKLAMAALIYVYVGSFLLFALAALLLWHVLYRCLIAPVEACNDAAARGWKPMVYRQPRGGSWYEIQQLDHHYSHARTNRSKMRDENARLGVALHYAKEAEQNRRQMTSAVAHELKTPLAVIHSYAEGLKERIAEDKRERYLEVILSETERLDELVLEMLDLSRLEAGKVKLARDDCSVSALAAAVFEKLELPAREKELEIMLDLRGACRVTADEGRLVQVITNFASNAIRYTPQGGKIWVKTYEDRNHVWFRVENSSQLFSQEELTRIWETFYRTDRARSGRGTGLGLAICKSILDLHDGLCKAENTENGVEFWFRLKK